jgi:hypothetical protein
LSFLRLSEVSKQAFWELTDDIVTRGIWLLMDEEVIVNCLPSTRSIKV